MPTTNPIEIRAELLGVNALNFGKRFVSSSRDQMFASHVSQMLVIDQPSERRIQTGVCREYAKYTYSTKMPANARILKVIDRYIDDGGPDGIRHNPEKLIIFEDDDTREIGCIQLNRYFSHHPHFGFKYKDKKFTGANSTFVPKGTILQDSPSVADNGAYMFGLQANVVFMTHPAIAEDGIMISRDILHKFKFRTYEKRVIEGGEMLTFLNIHGTKDKPKVIPDIGDKIPAHGMVAALREFDPNLCVVEQSTYDMMDVEPHFDRIVYAPEGGTVIDVKIEHDERSTVSKTPALLEAQLRRYDRQRHRYYSEILKTIAPLRRERGEHLKTSKALHRLLVEAHSVVTDMGATRVVKFNRGTKLDDWRIEITIEYEVIPTTGFKMTCLSAGKGVIVHVAEPHEMPRDKDGNRADIVMDPNATVSRMNLGRMYELDYNASGRDLTKEVCAKLGLTYGDKQAEPKIALLEKENKELVDHVWDRILGFYKILSPKTFEWLTNGSFKKPRANLIASWVASGHYIFFPTDNPVDGPETIRQLRKHYPSTFGPITYTGYSGKECTTKDPGRIGEMYIILLEKIADERTAVASGKLQGLGVLATTNKSDKYSTPTREQSTRTMGEAEMRLLYSYCDAELVAEIAERNNSIHSHRAVVNSILHADKPTAIERAVNRDEVPYGDSRPLNFVKHIAECAGWAFEYQPYNPYPEGIPQSFQDAFKHMKPV